MAISCIVSEIKRDISRKTPIFHTIFHFTCMTTENFLKVIYKILTQTAWVRKLLGGGKMLPKSSTLSSVHQRYI